MIAAIKIQECKTADKEHDKALRQYAHVGHEPGVICVAKAFHGLPDGHYYGILAHEIGHLIAVDDTEEGADKAANYAFGIRIRYRSGRHGEHLEYLTQKDVGWIKQFLDFLPEGHGHFRLNASLPEARLIAS